MTQSDDKLIKINIIPIKLLLVCSSLLRITPDENKHIPSVVIKTETNPLIFIFLSLKHKSEMNIGIIFIDLPKITYG